MKWTSADIEKLRAAAMEYPNISACQFDRTVAAQLGTSAAAVQRKRTELKIYIEASAKYRPIAGHSNS
jgi:hypothetical protein